MDGEGDGPETVAGVYSDQMIISLLFLQDVHSFDD
jgi:hypothetical protein